MDSEVLKKEKRRKETHVWSNDAVRQMIQVWFRLQIQIQQPALNPNQSDCSVGLACVVVWTAPKVPCFETEWLFMLTLLPETLLSHFSFCLPDSFTFNSFSLSPLQINNGLCQEQWIRLFSSSGNVLPWSNLAAGWALSTEYLKSALALPYLLLPGKKHCRLMFVTFSWCFFISVQLTMAWYTQTWVLSTRKSWGKG